MKIRSTAIFLFKTAVISRTCGMSEMTFRRRLEDAGVKLLEWKGAVVLPKSHVSVLVSRIWRSRMRFLLQYDPKTVKLVAKSLSSL